MASRFPSGAGRGALCPCQLPAPICTARAERATRPWCSPQPRCARGGYAAAPAAPAGPDRLLESQYEQVKGQWEERFASRYGFWRGACEDAAYAFLDCGIFEHGFARVRCAGCRAESLVAFSCQRRGLCPSCAAKRGALFGALLAEEVLEDVGHLLWTFTITRMLRPYLLHHRELLGRLCQASWQVVRELMRVATGERHLQPGMVAVMQTSGDLLRWHPHIHAIASRGGWDRQGRWVPDFLALALQHVPQPRLHQVRYYGHYANAARARRAAADGTSTSTIVAHDGSLRADPGDDEPDAADRRRLRRLWAQLLRRVYEVDPLTCRHCGGPMRILAFIQEPAAIRKILAHLQSQGRHPSRAPPDHTAAPARAAS